MLCSLKELDKYVATCGKKYFLCELYIRSVHLNSDITEYKGKYSLILMFMIESLLKRLNLYLNHR